MYQQIKKEVEHKLRVPKIILQSITLTPSKEDKRKVEEEVEVEEERISEVVRKIQLKLSSK